MDVSHFKIVYFNENNKTANYIKSRKLKLAPKSIYQHSSFTLMGMDSFLGREAHFQ